PSFLFSSHPAPPALHSFPTRRSSDLRHRNFYAFGPLNTPLRDPPFHRHKRHPSFRAKRGISLRSFSVVHSAPHDVISALCPLCRSEEHTSELQSRFDLVCRLLLEKKK